MPGQSSHLTIGRLRTLLVSRVTSIFRALLCLALAGCSVNDETVTPPQPKPQAPTIAAQPTVVVSDLGARVTATVNPNNLDTECYFEYGPTSTYGRRLPVKSIQAHLNNIVVSDTIANLGVDTIYHCRLAATNSAGTTHSFDKAFSVANTPPTILSETSVSVFGNTAVLTATVNANSRSTDCYFEYGPNTSYGTHTAAKSIGAGGTGVVVRDTLRSLSWDSTYHCRCVAVNAAGVTVGADKEVALLTHPVPFVYPLTVGTWWKYTYEWYTIHPIYITPVRPGRHILGSWIWEVKEKISTDSVRIEVLRTESVARDNQSDTLMTWITSFSASIGEFYYTVRWFKLMVIPSGDGDRLEAYWAPLITVPRFVESGTDTVTLGSDHGENNVQIAHYVSGKGLVSWRHGSGYMNYFRETITLDSVWVAP